MSPGFGLTEDETEVEAVVLRREGEQLVFELDDGFLIYVSERDLIDAIRELPTAGTA